VEGKGVHDIALVGRAIAQVAIVIVCCDELIIGICGLGIGLQGRDEELNGGVIGRVGTQICLHHPPEIPDGSGEDQTIVVNLSDPVIGVDLVWGDIANARAIGIEIGGDDGVTGLEEGHDI